MKPSERLRSRPRSASDSSDNTRPLTSTLPALSVSRPPMMCNSVDLPEPDAPTMDMVSPRRSAKFTLERTPVRRSPSSYTFATPVARRTMSSLGLFITERLGGLRTRGAPRRVEGRQQREDEGHEHHPTHVGPEQLARQLADVIDVWRQERLA